jgi:hypothetical protein
MENTIQDLRNHLFETITALKDPTKPMDLDRAKTVAEVARVVVDSAKAEVDFMRVTGSTGSGFIPHTKALTPPVQPAGDGKTVHRLRG